MLARSRPLFTYSNVASTLALVIALSAGTAYAANTIRSRDIVDGQVKRADLAASAVNSGKIADNAVTAADLHGADVSGGLGLGPIADGHCAQVGLSVAGAKQGETAVFAAQGAVQNGVVFLASRVPTDGNVTLNACNFSGTTMTAISDLRIRVMTFG